ncbi:hypothetical protein HanXRQr2_Chr03g0127541 [Helianthus annuus]|uniref:Uncharacterized protein n=1 Tax=Helianthus annuus TaxID=4232 RepID=A0A9K3JI15_HELAN|nr:hypothetical protein HanXRQr2_Chr03g0127541 [Helianthus annuus]
MLFKLLQRYERLPPRPVRCSSSNGSANTPEGSLSITMASQESEDITSGWISILTDEVKRR